MINDQALNWEYTDCNWCGSANYEVIFTGPDRLEGLPGVFTMVKCQQCGLFRQNPRLAWVSLNHYYPDNYAAYTSGEDDENPGLGYKIRQYGNWKKRRAIERLLTSGRVLDAGCGTGGFLEEMARSGKWDIHGVEPNEFASAMARKKLGETILTGKLRETNLEIESFDVVTLWCVLEHVEKPLEELRFASTLLKKGGWLIFSIPNYESKENKWFGKYWAGWDLPRHLYVFPRTVLSQMLLAVGLEIRHERCISTGYAILGHSIEFWSQSWESKHPRLKRALLRSYYSWPGRLLVSIPLKILDLLKFSTTLTIFAQRV